MGNKALIYRQKAQQAYKESIRHLQRLENAFYELEKNYTFLLNKNSYNKILTNAQHLAFSDQVFYRFSKLQDCMGAKLFKAILLAQGKNTNKPFLDILNDLEKMDILKVDIWFELRDIRNEIVRNYENNEEVAINAINMIYGYKRSGKANT